MLLTCYVQKKFLYFYHNELYIMFKQLDPEDYYLSEDGYIIFTEQYHLKRGYCCKSGCKHCPYGYDKKTDTFNKKKTEKTSINKNTSKQ